MSLPEELKNGLKIWGFSPEVLISDEGGWLPGIYDSRATARCAYKSLSYDDLKKLEEMINNANTLDRAITMDDLNDYSLGLDNIVL